MADTQTVRVNRSTVLAGRGILNPGTDYELTDAQIERLRSRSLLDGQDVPAVPTMATSDPNYSMSGPGPIMRNVTVPGMPPVPTQAMIDAARASEQARLTGAESSPATATTGTILDTSSPNASAPSGDGEPPSSSEPAAAPKRGARGGRVMATRTPAQTTPVAGTTPRAGEAPETGGDSTTGTGETPAGDSSEGGDGSSTTMPGSGDQPPAGVTNTSEPAG